MNIGLDLDHTITANVPFYKDLAQKYQKETNSFVYIITGRSAVVDLAITEAELMHWGFKKGEHYEELLMYPAKYYYSRHIGGGAYFNGSGVLLEKEWVESQVGNWKAKVCKDKGIDVFFDDNPIFVDEMRKQGIYVLRADGKYDSQKVT